MSEAIADLTPEERQLLGKLGHRLRQALPTLIPQWERALDELLAGVDVADPAGVRQESLSAAQILLAMMDEEDMGKVGQHARAYGEAISSQGFSHTMLGDWLAILRQSLLTVLTQRYADDPQLDRAILTFSKFFSPYMLQVTESFSSRQQQLLLEQQRALHQALNDAQRRLKELEVLNEVGQAISSTMELDDLLDLIYQQTSRLMDTTNFFITLYDPDANLLYFEVDVEEGVRQPHDTMNMGEGLTSYIVRTGQPLLLPHGPEAFLEQQGIERVGRPSLSWLGVPMLAQDRVVGVIAVQSYTQDGAYDEGHLRILSTIASQAAVAVANARLYQEARRRAEEMEALYRIGTRAASHLGMAEILQSVYEQAGVVMDTAAFFVALYDRDREEIAFELMYDRGERQEPFRLNKAEGGGLTGWVLDHGESLLIQDWEEDAAEELRALAIQRGDAVGSWLGVPMVVRGDVVGVLAAQSYEPNAFDPHHRQVLEMIAHQAAVAIENTRLYEEAQVRVAELTALQRIGLKLAATTDLSEVLDTVADSAMELLHPNDVLIFLYNAELDSFTLGTGLRDTGERGLFVPMPRKSGMTAAVARSGEIMVIEDVPSHPLYTQAPDRARELQALVGVPLVRAGAVLGVLNVSYYTKHRFTTSELRLLQAFADQAAVAVANARLFERAQIMMRDLAETSEAQAQLLELVRELSAPIVPLMEDVLVMPLIGTIDSQRGQQILDDLLQMVEVQRSRVVLMDITGVPVVDTSVAQILLRAVQAVRLLGGEAVLVGITPEVAQTLVSLGVDLRDMTTRADLQAGVVYALRQVGRISWLR